MDSIKCHGFDFFNNFDSANLARVENVSTLLDECSCSEAAGNSKNATSEVEVEFNLWTRPDCCGTEFENGNRTWFYFGMRANAPSVHVKLNLVDLNRQAKMYSQGMAPVFKVVPGRPQWERIRDKPVHRTDGNIFILSFKYKTPENPQSITYFAFTYPFSYGELQQMLDTIDRRFASANPTSKDDIYYTRECVCHSLDDRRIDLLTISSHHNIGEQREPRLKNLFPDENVPRPFSFVEKKVIFISARVHPGETPSSFVFNGLLNLLLNREDPIAIALRRLYVFKLIPCLNPDGVARGHYRTDTRGVNLNRVYLNPKFALHPSIFASRALLRYHHFGFEKEDEVKPEEISSSLDDSSGGESGGVQSDTKITTDVSHMTLEEKQQQQQRQDSEGWCDKCKGTDTLINYENVVPNVSLTMPTTDNHVYNTGKCVCCCASTTTDKEESVATARAQTTPPFSHGDANCNESGLFLYVDMHGHASKKGIFMYGNHFEELECNVECMLLPKLMSLNNHNFHFTACNFTERNMYLKDRRDGMSREGSGRVAVLKLTGLIRSYTLECNYNTGRLVNVLPSAIREGNCKTHTLLVPPKYTPLIFEEVGRALGVSILDLTSQNPNTRLPNSEFHTVNGLRDWLRMHCISDLGEPRNNTTPTPVGRCKLKNSSSLHAQGKPVRPVFIKTRAGSAVAKKKPTPTTNPKAPAPRAATTVSVARKENVAFTGADVPQPGCSYSTTRPNRSHGRTAKSLRPKMKRDAFKFKSAKADKTINHIMHNVQNTNCLVRQRLKSETATKLATITEKTKRATSETDLDRVQLREICFVKDGDGKTVIAKYTTAAAENKAGEASDDNLIVSWDAASAHATVFSQKQSGQGAFVPVPSRSVAEPGCSGRQGAFRVHNFARSASFTRNKRGKRSLRRLAAAAAAATAVEATPRVVEMKMKKRKKANSKGKVG